MNSGPKRHRQRPHVTLRQYTRRTGGVPGSVRIIAGDWRGRKLPVADLPGLRPTGDRARETLFNWLQAFIHGSRCLDLFAGSGALGFEAASRGAAEVVLVERARAAADLLRESAETLGARQVSVIETDALRWLEDQDCHSFDIVFVDPPFDSSLAASALDRIAAGDVLAPGGLVYLESPIPDSPTIPSGWLTEREKELGEVRIQLLKRHPAR